MKVTINWLKEFLDTDHLDPELVAHKLTMSGTEVGKVEDIGKSYENIVTGQVIESSPHPNADKLTVCKVDIKDKVLDIVCGASNFKKMDKVVVACVGAVLPNGMKIKKAKLRGAISEGMMCSEKELELSDESAGIMILDNDTKIGVPFISLAGLDDTVIEMEITPNRPDCMSIIGIAREISALTGIKFIGPVKKSQDAINTDKDFKIDIKDPDLCPRYSAKIFRDIPTAQTPLWLKTRLTLCDQRPVSLLVDLTNYVMLETGQPMHAFDKGLLSSNKIIIRTAAEKEKLAMIDGSSKALRGKDLVIADEKRPVAIAGVMGGKDTEINEGTKDVFLESANFYGPSVMKTSKDLNLRTEASSRFEKKIDPELTVIGLSRFEDILEGITGKVNSSCIYDSYLKTPRKKSINLNPDMTEKILGKRLEDNELSDILKSLGFKTSKKDSGTLEVGVPSYRAEDITREVDLIEEIARIYGFNRFESCPPKGFLKKGMLTKMQKDVRKVRDFLSCSGLYEVINYSFISKTLFKKTRLLDDSKYSNHVQILNPINEDYKYMRTSLLPSLLKNVKDNIKYGYSDLGLFEVSKVFYKNKKGELPLEDLNLGVLLTGCKKMKGWENEQSFFNYYDIKGYLEGLIDIFSRGRRAVIEKKEYGFFHPVISADVTVNGKKVGIIGSIHPAVLEGFDIENDTFYLEISLGPFFEQVRKEKFFNKISIYPSVDIDIAIIVDEDTDNYDITEEIKKLGGKILKSIRLFDLYKGKQIQAGKKSMAYSLNFRGDKATLKDNEVDIVVSRIVEGLKKSFSAKLRD